MVKASGRVGDSTKNGKGMEKALYQCSLSDCGAIVQRESVHVKNVHKIWGEKMT